ncbi:3-hydroxyacyl-CoA dehydrogenase [Kushneria sinocarnis]|uniref:L-gulonate 3-dehydrogenase n=1 Tax=Kushneria sinocarnis TaxID=595502 RepID=A0A420X0Y5_9GAMM|nr:3-hydroxyacyl-CoA dehydrogenase [Kushneria sinocarnis]RKR07407.1 3-hydroxyacyl-CoA dehydrogenase [Kushneria sinocarnis]
MSHVAIIGSGLIGRSWSVVFARGGHDVVLFDSQAEVLPRARELVGETLEELAANELLDEAPARVLERVRISSDLTQALEGAIHVQENIPERVALKRELFARLDELAAPDTTLASSTSGIPASDFTETLAHRERCLVAHPVNPPALIPLVELIPAPWTDDAVLDRTRALMAEVGQSPITLGGEIPGFAVNRLQGALLNEAFNLIEDGYLSVEDLDRVVSDGLGARWFFMGPIETIDLNAPEGVRDYMTRLGPMYQQIADSSRPRHGYSEQLLDQLERARRETLPADQRDERMAWRDRYLVTLAALKKRQSA